jgi:fructose-1,6-bisphosphatase II
MAALRGDMQCKLWPRNDNERRYAVDAGLDLDQVINLNDLVGTSNTFFAATGVTPGSLLRGVDFKGNTTSTHSVIMRSLSGTVRFIDATHRGDWLDQF